ncbi:MAG: TetR/AcrR family transcriptional regulator [Lachnospiraceae bacterium]|nr:TetR/AcrR family transcriptional regulator [Lachnospiraceae bacterium]
MPPKPKIKKEMIINAGKEVIQSEGIENLNVRKIASKLNCSTQPIMYHYKTVAELKSDIYSEIDQYHSAYIMNIENSSLNPMLSIGIRYILFAYEEKNYFKFLFQSNKFSNMSFNGLFDDDELSMIYSILAQEAHITKMQSKELFENLFIMVHGLASLLANNAMEYDEEYCIKILENTFNSLIKNYK